MSERARDIAESVVRWTGEAWKEWADSVKDSPEAHAYTLTLGIVLTLLVQAFL